MLKSIVTEFQGLLLRFLLRRRILGKLVATVRVAHHASPQRIRCFPMVKFVPRMASLCIQPDAFFAELRDLVDPFF